MVEIQSAASGASDCRRKNDARRVESVQLGTTLGSSSHANPDAPGARKRVSQTKSGVGKLRKISARLSPSDYRMGGQCEEGRDSAQAAGEVDRAFGAQRTN